MALRTTLESIARLAKRPPSSARVGCRGASSLPTGAPPCSGPRPAPVCPCAPPPRPACRALPSDRLQAVKVTCCPPSAGKRPPCAPDPAKPPMTCSRRKLSRSQQKSAHSCTPNEPTGTCGGRCVKQNDRVARRLAAAERARRENYEREVRERAAAPAARAAPAAYCLGSERECARATDGRQYAVLCGKEPPTPRCGPGRTPPPPQCVEVLSDGACKIQDKINLDPCAHRPRTLVQIDRSQTKPDKIPLKGVTMARTGSERENDTKSDKKNCEIKRSKPVAVQPCRLPSVLEALRGRGPGPCAPDRRAKPPHTRSLHTRPRTIIGHRDLRAERLIKAHQYHFSANLKSRSAFDVKNLKINRATSPLFKRMSSNSCDKNKNKKTDSWTSLKKICGSFKSGKKTETPKAKTSSACAAPASVSPSPCKPPPPCGPVTPDTKRVPPNPCAEKHKPLTRSKHKSPNPCEQKQNPSMNKKAQNPCGCKSPTPPKSPSSCKPCEPNKSK